ncbi:MAG: nuclear transport factor 2 family protein [Gemmatimonadota bacterium]
MTPLLMGLALTLGACEQQATETGEMEDVAADSVAAVDAEAQLDDLRIQYMEAWNARDMNAIGGMMTSSYEEISATEGVLGYDEAMAMMADSANIPPEGATLSIETHTLEVAESGDVAYGSGVSTMTIPMDGQEMTDSSRWVAGFKKVDGQWKIDRLAFAPNLAATEESMDGAQDTTGSM